MAQAPPRKEFPVVINICVDKEAGEELKELKKNFQISLSALIRSMIKKGIKD